MSISRTVYLRRANMLSPKAWADAIRAAGFPVDLDMDFDVERHSGYLPCRYEGRESGFEYFFSTLDETQVAYSHDGRWINLFRVQPNGTLSREKLVNMARHNYVTGQGGVEPNGSITPDKRWVIFTGNFDGERHVYAVSTATPSR